MSIAATPAHRSRIEYPDSDGQPMSDNTLQFKWIVTIKEGLEAQFRNDADVFVAGDLLWYPEEGKPKIRTAPDALVAFGRPKGYRGSYRQFEEGGIAPQVVFEVLSPGNRSADTIRKFRFYERYGVEEYYIYNPENGDLAGWKRGESGLEEIAEMSGYISPRLGVRFEPGEGPDSLRIFGSDAPCSPRTSSSSRTAKPSGSAPTPNVSAPKKNASAPKKNVCAPTLNVCAVSVWRHNSASWASSQNNRPVPCSRP